MAFLLHKIWQKSQWVEMASQKLVENSRLLQRVRLNVQLALCGEITGKNLWEFASVCTVVTKIILS